MAPASCPNRETLRQYSIGMLPDEQSDDLAGHLDACPDCQATIMTLEDAEDTLIGRLRAPLGSESCAAEPQLQAALAEAMTPGSPGAVGVAVESVGAAVELPPQREPASIMPRMLGEYQLIEELGHGGMGRVYKARHTKLDRVVAVKVLPRGRMGDQQAITRFEREMRAVGRLAHPNIVQAYDAREIDQTPVLVMEFVDGLDLAEIVRRVGRLPMAEACELMRQTAVALQCAHQHGLVHRDIKPSNIMLAAPLSLSGRGAGGEGGSALVKLLDLGLARFYAEGGTSVGVAVQLPPQRVSGGGSVGAAAVSAGVAVELPPQRAPGDEMTGSGQAMGTADYMAPEQASDSRSVDIRADLYSLGCTLYKLLSGRAPFGGPEYRGSLDKLHAHVHQQPPFIRRLVPEVPEGVAAILDRLLAKDPNDRFATPADVAEAIAPWCVGADLPALLQQAVETPASVGQALPDTGLRSNDVNRSAASQAQPDLPLLLTSWGWKWFAGQLILLMMAGGLGFALGIMIRIEKDGKTTTIEVPEGANARVSADGQIDVKLSGQSQAATPPALQFGPVIERVVNTMGERQGGEGLDLVGGKLVDVPKEYKQARLGGPGGKLIDVVKKFYEWPAQQRDKWCTANNVDLLVNFGEHDGGPFATGGWALMPEGLKLGAIQNEGWDHVTDEVLRSALTSPSPGSYKVPGKSGVAQPVVEVRERRGILYYEMSAMLAIPVTFAFQTRNGDLGILQVIRFTEEPPGIRIRYKLAQPSTSSAVRPGTNLLYFYADWAGPCQAMAPVVDTLANEGYAVQRVNIDQERELAKKFAITTVPYFVVLERGKEVDRFRGGTSYSQLKSALQRHSPQSAPPVSPVPAVPDEANVPDSAAAKLAPGTISLTEAVRGFNFRAKFDPVGKDQPPLSEDEVIAAVRWSLQEWSREKSDTLPVSNETLEALKKLVDLRQVPEGFQLEVITRFLTNNRMEFTKWSVRLRIPAAEKGFTTCISIRERAIGSRLLSEEEPKAMSGPLGPLMHYSPFPGAGMGIRAAISPIASAGPEWAQAMFDHTSHDFGVVARGAKVEHRFVIENRYKEDVHIKSVSSTFPDGFKPLLDKPLLRTSEKAEILVTVDTVQFVGRKSAKIKVSFDAPFPAEVELQATVYIGEERGGAGRRGAAGSSAASEGTKGGVSH